MADFRDLSVPLRYAKPMENPAIYTGTGWHDFHNKQHSAANRTGGTVFNTAVFDTRVCVNGGRVIMTQQMLPLPIHIIPASSLLQVLTTALSRSI
jgi:hypothetical protein